METDEPSRGFQRTRLFDALVYRPIKSIDQAGALRFDSGVEGRHAGATTTTCDVSTEVRSFHVKRTAIVLGCRLRFFWCRRLGAYFVELAAALPGGKIEQYRVATVPRETSSWATTRTPGS